VVASSCTARTMAAQPVVASAGDGTCLQGSRACGSSVGAGPSLLLRTLTTLAAVASVAAGAGTTAPLDPSSIPALGSRPLGSIAADDVRRAGFNLFAC
jgi:hypothetical protein